MVVNNNAAAVLLVLAALADGRDVPVSRGESVEIGGSFRVPEVMEQSGARLVDVGTTNRTRLADYRRAIDRSDVDAALVLKVHPSNYRVDGFVEATSVAELADARACPSSSTSASGLLDVDCPWLAGGPPAWLRRRTGGAPDARRRRRPRDLQRRQAARRPAGRHHRRPRRPRRRCRRHPLARALRPGGLVLGALQTSVLAYLDRDAERIPFWAMVARPVEQLQARADHIVERVDHPAVCAQAMEALPGAGSAPGVTMPSYGVAVRRRPRRVAARPQPPGDRAGP